MESKSLEPRAWQRVWQSASGLPRGLIQRVLLLGLLLVSTAWAGPLEEGMKALESGDLEESRRQFSRLKGEEASLARARMALVLGRAEDALSELNRESIPFQVTRLEALCELQRFTEAEALLRKLELERHGDFPPPYDFQFYLYRGYVEQAAARFGLAERNYSEALRRANSPKQKLQAHSFMASRWLAVDEVEKAQEELLATGPLLTEVKDVWTLASQLEFQSRLQHETGDLISSVAHRRAAREIYLSLGNPVKAADALYASTHYTDLSNDYEGSLTIIEKVLDEYLAARAYVAAVYCLNNLQALYSNLASTPAGARLAPLYKKVLSELPQGPELERARLFYADFLILSAPDSQEIQAIYKDLLESSSRAMRIRAHRGLANEFRKRGDYDKAQTELGKALEISQAQVRADIDWQTSPGPLYLAMSYVEKARHQHLEALQLARQGIVQEPGEDWTRWRTEARYQSLMSATEAYDLEEASLELSASLVDIEKLPLVASKAGSFTTILASLLLNQSVSDDVIDPAELLLRDYSDLAEELLNRSFKDHELSIRFLAYFDSWHRQTLQRRELLIEPFPLLYKGLFLEALGRFSEAESALNSALQSAEKHQVVQAQMLSRVILARIAFRRERKAEAVDLLSGAAELSRKLNPQAARFYSLVAGSAQRDQGRLQQALQSFDSAIELNPEESGPGLYGRATTLEKLGRTQEALVDLDKALAHLASRGKLMSVARVKAVKARLLVTSGKKEEAEALFEASHSELSSHGRVESLASQTMEFGDFLLAQEKRAQALELTTRTLDRIAEWHNLTDPSCKPLFERAVTLALASGQQARALQYLQLSHSAELLETVDLSLVETGEADTQKLLEEVNLLKSRISKLQERTSKADTRAQRESMGQLLAGTRTEFFEKLGELKSKEPDFEALVQVSGSQLSAIQSLLSPESALVQYFPAQDRLYIFVVTSSEFTIHEVSVSRAELTKLVQEYLLAASRSNSLQASFEPAAARLYSLLIHSTGSRLNQVRNLQIIPSGPLWEVPFSSLLDAKGQPLNEDFTISYLSSSELLKLFKTRDRKEQVPLRPLLVSGAKDLHGAEAEVEGIAALFEESIVIKAKDLSLKRFLANLDGSDLIHIASHSTVSSEGGKSFVHLGPDRLSLEQIYGLKLLPSSLVVLSSCRSAVGTNPAGKEVTSLATAFSVAGASTVIASRWPVDDRSTAKFFGFFYPALLQGKSRGEALRLAELRMKEAHPHPYFWAGFTLLGNSNS